KAAALTLRRSRRLSSGVHIPHRGTHDCFTEDMGVEPNCRRSCSSRGASADDKCEAQDNTGVSKSEAKVYAVSTTYTTLSFTATKWIVFKEEGLFQDFSGTLTYSSQDPTKCKIDVTVRAASRDTRVRAATKFCAPMTSSTSKNTPPFPSAARR